MKLLFNVWPRTSHLNGCLTLASHCRAKGHEVVFFCFDGSDRVKEKLRQTGLHASCYSPPDSTPSPNPPDAHYLRIGQRLQEPDWRQKYLERLFVHSVPTQIEPLRAVIRAVNPDVLVTEAVSYSGAIAASLEGIPWATLAASWGLHVPLGYSDSFSDALQHLDPLRRRVAASFGVALDFRWTQVVSPHLNLTVGIDALTPPSPATPGRSALLRGIATPRQEQIHFPWTWLNPNLPLVFISSGTEFEFDAQVATQLVNAALTADAQVVFASLRSLSLGSISRPERLLRLAYVPQVELLRRAKLFVTAGGCSSILDAVATRVPVLAVPIAHDQPLNAALCERAGIGLVASPERRESDDLFLKIEKLLRPDSPVRSQIERLEWPTPEFDLDKTLLHLERL